MSQQLSHSMFHRVLFPPECQETETNSGNFNLRRLKRYTPEPNLVVASHPLVVFDLETTGLDFDSDRIIEIGAQKYVAGELKDQLSTLVHTNMEITDAIGRLTGIEPEMLVGKPTIEQALPDFLKFINGSILVAHNAEFDWGMIKAAAGRQGIDLEWPCFCTVKLARLILPDLENRKLDTIATHYGLTFEARHRSIGDVKVTAAVLQNMIRDEGQRLRCWQDFEDFQVS